MVDERTPPSGLPTRTEAEGATVDLPEGLGFFSTGQVLGERYEVLEMLGRGGMGEVWRAFDLKLRVEVALKALREDLTQSERRLEMLRREVLAAREVMSPNVCRIFDLIEIDGRELVSMEYVDGATLLGVLQERGPLELKEAQDIASQFLSGLEAIHKAGLVHRDVKPENIMLTRAGRVVVMDFGLARGPESGAGSVSGTPAYMAPEHAAGQEVDARADVYSAGVVLAEMVSPEGIKSYESRQSVWEGVRSEPAEVPDSPWAPVIKRAVARDRARRPNSAHTLIRELEDVTLRVEGAEDLHPYPGLSSFSEEDAEFFFGREAEIETVWRRLENAHLLAIVGASGSGKSSLIEAGLRPNAPPGWQIARCTPGNAAFSSLRRVLVRELSGDAESLELLVDSDSSESIVEAAGRWRSRHDEVLLVIDQFEELFTQTSAEEQGRFASLVGRLAIDADLRVLVSMRDDFLLHCNRHEGLRPVFATLTPLDPPTGAALRRAVTQPALKCGYRFEDDELLDEILVEVAGERGALPMLAFAASRMWDKRDREAGLLTRQAYHDIGGVGGALARHAEATVDRIGAERIPIVRELFQNLVTAEGTRAVREWDELLSVFEGGGREGINPSPSNQPGTTTGTESPPRTVGAGFTPARDAAAEVLAELIDARLLTSYEVREDENEPIRRVEIIHESLLANWPRLVRWQTQDQEGAQLRDELRQSARAWDEHDRHDDRLWAGTAYREYLLWREHYPGGLTESEEAFGAAMTRHATRRRRRRRVAVTSAFVVLLVVLAVIGGFWRQSISETRRAEAANLFSVAQLAMLDERLAASLAFSTHSLEHADNPEVRRLAVETLWRRPAPLFLPTSSPYSVDFSPDGRWLVTADDEGGAKLWPSDGGQPTVLEGSDVAMEAVFSPRGDLVAANMDTARRRMGLWSVPEGRLLRSFVLGEQGETMFFVFSGDGSRLITSTETPTGGSSELEIRSWPVAGGEPDLVARLVLPPESATIWPAVDIAGSRLAWAEGTTVRIARFEGTTLDLDTATRIEIDDNIAALVFDEQGRQLAVSDRKGTVRVYSLESDPPPLAHTLILEGADPSIVLLFDPSGDKLATGSGVWDLTAPPDSEPMDIPFGYGIAFHPNGSWAASSGGSVTLLWPLDRIYPRVLRGHDAAILDLVFTPDSKQLISSSKDGSLRAWQLDSNTDERHRILHQADGNFAFPIDLAMAPDGSFLVSGNPRGQVIVHSLSGAADRQLEGFTDFIGDVAVGPQSRLVAAGAGGYNPEEAFVRVWEAESGEVHILDAADRQAISLLRFTPEGDLWVLSKNLQRWQISEAQPSVVEEFDLSDLDTAEEEIVDFDLEHRQLLAMNAWRLSIRDLDSRESRELSSHSDPNNLGFFNFDPSNELVISSNLFGYARVGPVTGEEPHLLTGHGGFVWKATVSPDGRWIATGADDGTIRLWPMPDISKQPFHTLPREEFIAKLKLLTNLRAVRDPTSSLGWEVEFAPFPGWETVPEW